MIYALVILERKEVGKKVRRSSWFRWRWKEERKIGKSSREKTKTFILDKIITYIGVMQQ